MVMQQISRYGKQGLNLIGMSYKCKKNAHLLHHLE